MKITFQKYQGTGNDFVIIDNRRLLFPKNNTIFIARLCDRKFGIGADGLMLLENHSEYDFKMVYYNADGRESTMCGNGGRCLSRFASTLGIGSDTLTFEAIDGVHRACLLTDGRVRLKMNDVNEILLKENGVFLDTGSPHHVLLVEEIDKVDVKTVGSGLRYGWYGEAGANINFAEAVAADTFAVRTYERGVEGETLSCGTGVTAVALAAHYLGKTDANRVVLQTPGGLLEVAFEPYEAGYKNIWLTGPAEKVFEGVWKERND